MGQALTSLLRPRQDAGQLVVTHSHDKVTGSRYVLTRVLTIGWLEDWIEPGAGHLTVSWSGRHCPSRDVN